MVGLETGCIAMMGCMALVGLETGQETRRVALGGQGDCVAFTSCGRVRCARGVTGCGRRVVGWGGLGWSGPQRAQAPLLGREGGGAGGEQRPRVRVVCMLGGGPQNPQSVCAFRLVGEGGLDPAAAAGWVYVLCGGRGGRWRNDAWDDAG